MTIAVLALQGAFIEHEHMLQKLGADTIELRKAGDLQKDFDGLILPGGESTVQGKLLHDLDIAGQEESYFGTLPMTVRRNAYGRQLGSFHTTANANGIGEISMTFIRAPYVESVHADAAGEKPEVLSVVQDRIVGVKYHNQMAFAFHPELDQDTKIHETFLGMIHK